MKAKLTITFLAVAMTLGMVTTVTAQSSQNSDVQVNVSDTVALDARPSTLSYGNDGTGITPGALDSSSDEGFGHIDIENIGAVPIEQVHAESSMHDSQPFGDSGAVNFDTGNFFVMSTQTASSGDYSLGTAIKGSSNFRYLNRVEYADTTPPEYIETESSGPIVLNDGTQAIASGSLSSTDVGRFRVGEAEYFWVLYQATTSTATGDNWVLRIGQTPHTPNELGTIDYTDNETANPDYVEYSDSDASSPGGTAEGSLLTGQNLVSFDTSNPGLNGFTGQPLLDESGGENTTSTGSISSSVARNYNLYVDGADSQIIRSSYNTVQSSPQGDWTSGEVNSGGQTPIFLAQTDGSRLQPGQNFPIDIGVQVPNGVDRDRISTGTVSIIATENSTLG